MQLSLTCLIVEVLDTMGKWGVDSDREDNNKTTDWFLLHFRYLAVVFFWNMGDAISTTQSVLLA